MGLAEQGGLLDRLLSPGAGDEVVGRAVPGREEVHRDRGELARGAPLRRTGRDSRPPTPISRLKLASARALMASNSFDAMATFPASTSRWPLIVQQLGAATSSRTDVRAAGPGRR